jgi:hypothetical protein
MTEMITIAFFAWVGAKFKPVKQNPYLRLSQNEDLEDGTAITMNGLFENVTKLNRGTTIQNEIDELIPGSIAGKQNNRVYVNYANLGNAMDSDDSEDDSLLPKVPR